MNKPSLLKDVVSLLLLGAIAYYLLLVVAA